MIILRDLELGSSDETGSFCGTTGQQVIFLVGKVKEMREEGSDLPHYN